MQKIVVFIDSKNFPFETHSKIGHLFMNRFAIDEDANFEIVKVLILGPWKISGSEPVEYEIDQEGIDLIDDKKLFHHQKFCAI